MGCIDLSGPFMFLKCVRQRNLNSEVVSEVYSFIMYVFYVIDSLFATVQMGTT